MKSAETRIQQGIPPGAGKLYGKVCVITASTDGIGFAIASRFVQEDALAIYISSRKQENVNNAVLKLEKINQDKLASNESSSPSHVSTVIYGLVAHVGKREDRLGLIDKVRSDYGKIDVLVLNAAVSTLYGPLMDPKHEITEAQWDKMFEINVKSTFFMAREAMPLVRKAEQSPSIILISSIAAYDSLPALAAYSVTKTSLLALNRALAAELAAEKIRVNCIAPGIIRTRFSSKLTEGGIKEEVIPMGRYGTTEDIASVASFLASADSSYITGETLVAAGGMRSRL